MRRPSLDDARRLQRSMFLELSSLKLIIFETLPLTDSIAFSKLHPGERPLPGVFGGPFPYTTFTVLTPVVSSSSFVRSSATFSGVENRFFDTTGVAKPCETGPLEFDDMVKGFDDPAVDGGPKSEKSLLSAIVSNVVQRELVIESTIH